MNEAPQRQPHAALDVAGRLPKAEKIRVLLDAPKKPGLRLLEVGTGSGALAHYFATQSDLRYDVDAVDVVDQRQVTESYRYRLVEGVHLPFPNGSFDIVISNHVIEHVGDRASQCAHLCEVARVLKETGQAYLATPNRWQLVEPHFHLAFLSWLPARWRTSYLRWRKRGDIYDCEPLQLKELESLLKKSHFTFQNACVPAIRHMLDVEVPSSWLLRLVGRLPHATLFALRGMCPTHIYLLKPTHSTGDGGCNDV
jgi:ubiquinone/menaquinone biosynthesis C-methylase UbiE